MTLEGQTLGEFEILAALGHGGMGAVYKARQISLKRIVALKTLQPAMADDEAYIARFQQEAIAAAALNHPNLVQVYSAGQSDGLHWFSMEYVEGESARARLRRQGRIDPREALTIAICVATALQYGWRKAALIHRDIKPDNIFLSRYGEVKLGDLGLAKSAAESKGLTSTGHSLGTPYYISPEQARDSKAVDFRADIYSLGCTLFHMVTGRPPFDGSSAAAILLKHLTEPPPSLQEAWPQCPPRLSELVGKMMQKDPGERQQDYETLLDELRRAYAMPGAPPAADEPAPHAPPESPVRPGPPARPRPGVAKGEAGPASGRDRNDTYEIEMDLEASAVAGAPPAPEREIAPVPGSEPPHAAALEADIEAPTVPTPVSRPQSQPPPASRDPRPAPAPEADPASSPQSQSAPAGTGELKLVAEFEVDKEAPTVAGPMFIPAPVPARKSPALDPPHQSFPLGKIIGALLVVIAAWLYFTHHGKKPFMTVADDSSDPPAVESPWRDWLLDSRSNGYFLYHREFLDHKDEVIFQRRAAANSGLTFRNGKIKVRCIIPPADSPEQYVQFYLRQSADAQGVVRRYEAYLTRNSIVFALNDSAQGAHEITHWSIPNTPDLPINILMEIVARKNTFTVLFENQLIGIAQDDTLPGPGTYGVDGPAETRLTMLSCSTADPAPTAATASPAGK